MRLAEAMPFPKEVDLILILRRIEFAQELQLVFGRMTMFFLNRGEVCGTVAFFYGHPQRLPSVRRNEFVTIETFRKAESLHRLRI